MTAGRASTPEAEAARRRKIAAARRDRMTTTTHGKNSGLIKKYQPVGCDTCPIKGCPAYAKGAICSLRPEIMALAEQTVELTGDDRYYDRAVLARYLAGVVQMNGMRLVRGTQQEIEDSLGIDESVTRLSTALVDQLQKLWRLLGHEKRDPLIVLDQRSVQVSVNEMPDDQYKDMLNALAELRRVGGGQLTNRLLEGDTSALDVLDNE